jgi:hypothetical protein
MFYTSPHQMINIPLQILAALTLAFPGTRREKVLKEQIGGLHATEEMQQFSTIDTAS